jgi:hypothetical protein
LFARLFYDAVSTAEAKNIKKKYGRKGIKLKEKE